MSMKKGIVRILIAALLFISLFTFIPGCSNFPGATSGASPAIPPGPPLKVATGTTQIAAVVNEVGGDAVSVVNLVPPSQDPLKYQLTPEDLAKLSGIDILIIHDWQTSVFPPDLVTGTGAAQPFKLFQLGLSKDWLVPEGQTEAAEKITAMLAEVDEKRAAFFQENLTEYKKKIDYEEASIIAKAMSTFSAKPLASTNVICEEHLRDFFTWIGLDVSATFSETRPLADEEINNLIEQGTKDKVILVADSSPYSLGAGVEIASKLNVELVLLTDFPGNMSSSGTWIDTITYDANRLLTSS